MLKWWLSPQFIFLALSKEFTQRDFAPEPSYFLFSNRPVSSSPEPADTSALNNSKEQQFSDFFVL